MTPPRAVTAVRTVAGIVEDDSQAYFHALIARPDYWLHYFHDGTEVAGKKYLTWDADAQAVKVTIPQFFPNNRITEPMAIDADRFVPADKRKTLWPAGRMFRIDDEVMTVASRVLDTAGNIVAIKPNRAQLGTAAASHPDETPIGIVTNTLQSKLPLPLGTVDGQRYVFVWDAKWTDSFLNVATFTHKAFQFFSGGDDYTIWFEPQANYSRAVAPDVAAHQVRSYNQMSELSGATNNLPLEPRVPFNLRPNVWTRFFLSIDQRTNDFDPVNMWVADETRDPVQTLTNIGVTVRMSGKKPGISGFQIEMNSSTDTITRADLRDFIAYVRNFVALRDVTDMTGVLVRPLPS